MNWITLSLGSALTFAVVSALDKVLIQRFMPTPRVFIVLTGVCQLALAFLVLPLAEFGGYGIGTTLISYASGLLAGIYLLIMFWVMRRQDVSRVVPITSTHTIFVAILAQVFLGESVSALAWAGIVVTMGGAALMSFGPTTYPHQRNESQLLPFALLMVSSLSFGLSQYLSKVVASDIDIWSLFVWRGIGMASACIGLMIRRDMIPDLMRTIRNPAAMGLTVLTEGVLVLVAVTLQLSAIFSGPVSLVVTVMAIRPLFVFILGIGLSLGVSRVLNEPLQGKILAVKLAAIVMTVGGVIAVTIK